LEFWKNAALRVRALERQSETDVKTLKASPDISDCAQDLMLKLRQRKDMRNLLRDTILAMQETRQLVDKGLSTLGKSWDQADDGVKAAITLEYIHDTEHLKSSLNPLSMKISDLLEASNEAVKIDNEEQEKMVIRPQSAEHLSRN
jgi:hypothetical protein